MKNRKLFLSIILICMVMISTKSLAQFEQKFTFQASGGVLKPLGDLGDVFSAGLSLDAGAQYNYSRSLSFVGLFKFVKLYPMEEFGEDFELQSIGISLCPKYRFLVEKRVNPFVFGGVGLYFTKYSLYDTGEWIDYKFPTSFGYNVGVGVDASLSETIALFFQGGYNSTSLKDEGFSVDFNNFYFQVGVNISFLKSKSL